MFFRLSWTTSGHSKQSILGMDQKRGSAVSLYMSIYCVCGMIQYGVLCMVSGHMLWHMIICIYVYIYICIWYTVYIYAIEYMWCSMIKVWYGMVWYGTVRYGMVWYGMYALYVVFGMYLILCKVFFLCLLSFVWIHCVCSACYACYAHKVSYGFDTWYVRSVCYARYIE